MSSHTGAYVVNDRRVVGELKVRVLGALDIQGVDKQALGSRKARTLVKVLAVARGQPVPVARLVDCLWPDRPPARPSQQISVLISRLRSVLGPERLPRSDAGYRLIADWIDLDVANNLAAAATRRLAAHNYASARLAAEAALALMRGEFLADEPESSWADDERAAVIRLGVDVRRTAARAALAVGDFASAREMSEAVVAADIYDEGALQVLMAALTHGGQPGSALAAFARSRKRLREDLGVNPSPATDAVHKAILQGKPIPGLVIAVASQTGRPPRTTPIAQTAPAAGLVGRAAELAFLDSALSRMPDAGVELVVVEGESGIGKTRLVTHWARATRAAGTTVLMASCAGLDRLVPLQPLVAALDQFVEADRRRGHALLGSHPAYRTLVGATVPEPSPAVIAPSIDGSVRRRMFAVIFETFVRVTGPGPAVLVLDDVHLAGELTNAWLDFAKTASPAMPLLIVVTQLTDSRMPDHVDQLLTMGPLDISAAGDIVGGKRAQELHAVTGGNPLFLRQLAMTDAVAGLPATIRQAVDLRSERLGTAAHTLRTAAAIGPIVDPDLLMDVLNLHPADLFSHLESGVRALFLDEGEAAFTFHHELVREAMAAGLTGPWRAHVHRNVARLLAARPGPEVIQVAHHARLAGDATQAVSILQVAARTCFRRSDYAEADLLLSEAIELEDTADTRLQRADVRITMGQFARAAEDARAAIVRGAGAAGMETAAWCSYYLGEYAHALTLANEGAALAESAGVRARCLVIAGRLLHADGDLQESEKRYSEAGQLADEVGLTTLVAVWVAALRCDQGRAREALELLRLPSSTVTDSDQPLMARHRQLASARALMMLGRPAEALSALDALRLWAGPVELGEGAPDGDNLRASILLTMGALEAADRTNLKAVEEARGRELRPLLEVSLIGLAESRLAGGARRSASRYLADAARTCADPYPFQWVQRARVKVLQGRLALAAGKVARALSIARELARESGQSGDMARNVAARLLEAEALAVSGASLDTRAIGDLLKSAAEVLGGEAWRLTARLAEASGNQVWSDLAKRQYNQLVRASGSDAAIVRRSGDAFMERITSTA